MSIGVTTIILFAVFALLLFASCPISRQHCYFFYCSGSFFPVLGSDYLYYHAEDEQRCRKLFPCLQSPCLFWLETL